MDDLDLCKQEIEKYRGSNGFIHLKRSYSTLYTRSLFTTDLTIVINKITEYDLKSANISAMEASGKFDQQVLDNLRGMSKMQREVLVGKMRRKDKRITKIISNGIQYAKQCLFEANLIQDAEVVSIKNDAVFIAGRKLKCTKFGPYQFVPKNTYSLFLKLDKQLEFYYDGRHDKLDIKGIGENVLSDPDQINGMICFLKTVFRLISKGRTDDLRVYLIRFVDDYKSLNLPVCYYKEFNSFNIYRLKLELQGYEYHMSSISESDKDTITGIYNYTRYILPIVQAFLN